MTVTITKAKLALAVLAVALLVPATAFATHTFGDVPTGAFYHDAVEWALDNKITTGTSTTTFSPEDSVTRGQNITFAHRYDTNVVQPKFDSLDTTNVTNTASIAANTSGVSTNATTGAANTATGAANTASSANNGTAITALEAAAPIARSAAIGDVFPEPTGPTVVLTVTITAPVAGLIQLIGSSWIFESGTGGIFDCNLSLGTGATIGIGAIPTSFRTVSFGVAATGICTTNAAVAVAAGTHVLNLVLNTPGTGDFDNATLDALFIPGGTVTVP